MTLFAALAVLRIPSPSEACPAVSTPEEERAPPDDEPGSEDEPAPDSKPRDGPESLVDKPACAEEAPGRPPVGLGDGQEAPEAGFTPEPVPAGFSFSGPELSGVCIADCSGAKVVERLPAEVDDPGGAPPPRGVPPCEGSAMKTSQNEDCDGKSENRHPCSACADF
jgi:hypothetical protein